VKIGDLVKVEGGTLRPDWYGETGIITSLKSEFAYQQSGYVWYEVALPTFGARIIRKDMLVMINESR